MRLRSVTEYLRNSFWFVPTISIAAAFLAGFLLPLIALPEGGLVNGLLFGGGGDGARGVLEVIAGSVITVTSLTFSLTVVTLQLASSQFSPRLLRTFLRDVRNQFVLGTLLATFVFSLTVLRTIRTGSEGGEFVPRLAITVAFLMAIASVGALVWFIQHIVSVIRIDALMSDVRGEARQVIKATFPPDENEQPVTPVDVVAAPPPSGAVLIPSLKSGFLLAVDHDQLVSYAQKRGLAVYLEVAAGDWLLQGAPWARVVEHGEPQASTKVAEALLRRVSVGNERSSQQDAGYGVVQLVDIASKALSPGINDPTTAVHAVHHLADLMVDLVQRPLGDRALRNAEGHVSVVIVRPTFADFLEMSCGQIRRYGADEPAVGIALLDLLVGVGQQATTQVRQNAIRDQLAALKESAGGSSMSSHDLARVTSRLEQVNETLTEHWGAAG